MTISARPIQVHFVSHTHWDREWYLTYEQFRLRLVGLVDRLLDLMEARPDFRYFHLDGQTIVLEDYLELRPHQEARLRRLIGEGRILIGPWYDMPDEFLVSGESIVRNLALGHRLGRRFGLPMPVGYLPDLFGHVGQMPQILRRFGLDNAVLWRGFGGRRAEYWWDGPDGSRVLMLHLPPEGYCNALRVHLDPKRMVERTARAIEAEAARTSVGQVLLMNGVDHVEPHAVIPELIEQVGVATGTRVSHATLPQYVSAVRSAVGAQDDGAGLEIVRGELRSGEEYANLLPGVLSARVYLKQANARIQAMLEKRAEPLATWAHLLGAPYPAGELAYAWKTLLQNHPHDSICGCSVDAVHEENMTRFARVEQVARAVVESAAEAIATVIPAGPSGSLRLIAINTSGQPYDGVVEATVDLPYASAEPHRVMDADGLDRPVTFWPAEHTISAVTTHDGRHVAFQTLDAAEVTVLVMSRREPPWPLLARRVRLAWTASLPASGYASFDCLVSPASSVSVSEPVAALTSTDRSAENAHVRLTVNDDGTVDVDDKRSGTRYRRCGELEDVGDVGDEYTYSPTPVGRRITSANAASVTISRVQAGPARVSFRVDLDLSLPAGASDDRQSRTAEMVSNRVSLLIWLDAESPRINWEVTVNNQSRDHRLRLQFPVGTEAIDHVRAGTAFAVVTRPAKREVPERVRVEQPVSFGPTEWVTEAGSGDAGAVLLGEGLMEYEASDDGDGARLGLTLLRSVGYLSRGDLPQRPSGHAGPGLPTPGAQCLGTHTFRLAFEPRTSPPSNGALLARASTFASAPHVVPSIGSAVTLPPAAAFLGLDPLDGEIQLSACYWSAESDALVVRVFNPNAQPARVRLSAMQPVRKASRVDFLEREVEPLRLDDDVVQLDVGAFAIETVMLRTRA